MATIMNDDLAQLSESINGYSRYPMNLVNEKEFGYVLKAYNDRIEKDEANPFRPKSQDLIFWDLNANENNVDDYRATSITNMNDLQSLLAPGVPDPRRRIIFLQSPSSRDALSCTREQATVILSHHQVMASFLEHIFTFKAREHPHNLASWSCEDHLGIHDAKPGLKSMNRSGIRIQDCFNVLGIENDPKDKTKTKWLQRQVAAYHSFDVIEGTATSVVIKGNSTARERLKAATSDEFKRRGGLPRSRTESFGQSLQEKLLLLQWCSENWPQYLDVLEERYRTGSIIPRYEGAQELADDTAKRRVDHRESSFKVGDAPPTPGARGIVRRWSSRLVGMSAGPTRQNTGLSVHSLRRAPTLKNENLDLDKLASFKDVQNVSALCEEIQGYLSVIDQNTRVLRGLRSRYQDLVHSKLFKERVAHPEDLEHFQMHTDQFEQKASQIEARLDSYRDRLQTILCWAKQTAEQFNHLFQIQNTRTAEYFAVSSQDSAALMGTWTEKMHQKTLSMHVITLFTLIFLPGTFVATIFSSGIMTFGEEGKGGFGKELGDWKVRVAGLKLFFAICFPLMCLTLCAWLVIYCVSRHVRAPVGSLPLDIEKGTTPAEKAGK